MVAQIVSCNKLKTLHQINDSNRVSKIFEMKQGFDGFLIYDFQLVDEFKLLWNENCLLKNQIEIIPDVNDITPLCLISINDGKITLDGIIHNINVSLLFIYHWLSGKGIFFFNNAVEDSATAEISRQQIWQWIHHSVLIEQSTTIVEPQLIFSELKKIVKKNMNLLCKTKADRKRLKFAQHILIEIVTSKFPIEFITTYLNDNHIFQEFQVGSKMIKPRL